MSTPAVPDPAVGTEWPGRRLLIATAVAHHTQNPAWDRPGLVEARNDVVSLFTGELGYEDVGVLGLNPTKAQLTAELRRFSRSPGVGPSDMLAVYLGCHGEILDDGTGEHVLLTADTDPDDLDDALPTAELAHKILKGTRVRRLLLMLDACYSGRGGNELAVAALTRMTERWAPGEDTGLVVMTSALPADQAQVGAFPALLRDAVASVATAGHVPPTLALDAVVAAMNANPRRPGFQHVGLTTAGLTGHVPPFLRNPRHDPTLTGVDLAIQHAAEWEAQAEQSELSYRATLLRRAMGSHDAPGGGWWFSGRHTALREITRWLDAPDPARPLLTVTGDPGSGKTAVLGLIATLAHPERRRTVPLDTLRLSAAAVPAADAIDAVVYAQDLTTEQVMRRIAAAAHIEATTPGQLLDRLGDRPRPFTVLVDGLDEATAPQDLTGRLLRPLTEHARGRLRLLVGTRPHLLPHLAPSLDRGGAVDLDGNRYVDRKAMTAYAVRGLLGATVDSAYRDLPRQRVWAVAEAVAQAAHPSFLVARITAATLASQSPVTDPSDPAWLAGLPRLPGQAMRRDLDIRLGADAARARDLLLPVAFAQGQGLPWEDLWPALASRFADRHYTDDDLLWLRSHAGSYIVENTEDDRSVYRLYHQALVEHLRDGIDPRHIHSAFVDILLDRVPITVDARLDWAHAHPYTRRHLASHATKAGRIDQIVADTDYLVHADPDTLLPALYTATAETCRTIRFLYHTTASTLRRLDPHGRRQVLAVAAARFNSDTLKQQLSAPLRWQPRWATGTSVSTALLRFPLIEASEAVACTDLQGHPIAVTGGARGEVRVWDLISGELRTTLTGHKDTVSAVACAQIGDHSVAVIASHRPDSAMFGEVRVWDLVSGELRTTLTGHKDTVSAVACAQIGDHSVAVIASRRPDSAMFGEVRVWDLVSGELRTTLTGHTNRVRSMACTRIGDRPVAVTVAVSGKVRVWDLVSGELRTTLADRKHAAWSVACTWIGDRPVAVTGGVHGHVWVWDLVSGELRTTLTGHTNRVRSMACTWIGDRPVAVTGGAEGKVQICDLVSGELRTTLTGHKNEVSAVACTQVGDRPVAVTVSRRTRTSANGEVLVWDLTSDKEVPTEQRQYWTHLRAATCTQVRDRPVAVTVADFGEVRVWDLVSGEPRTTTVAGHTNRVLSVACTRIGDRPVAVTGGAEGKVRVWDLISGELRTTLTGHKRGVRSVACTQIGDRPVAVTVAASRPITGKGEVWVWDLISGELRTTLTGHKIRAWSVACTQVGDRPLAVTVTGGATGKVWVWDLISGELRTTLTGHKKSRMLSVACTRIGDRPVAVTGGADGHVRVWDLISGELRTTLTGHKSRVSAVACTQVGDRPLAVTGDNVGTVRVWDLITSRGEIAAHTTQDPGLSAGPNGEIVIATPWELAVLAPLKSHPQL